MESNAIFREMPLTCIITNFSAEGGFERVYLATGRKPQPTAVNRFRNAKTEEKPARSAWNGNALHAKV